MSGLPMLTDTDDGSAESELARLGVATVLGVGDVSLESDVSMMVDPGDAAGLSTMLGTDVQEVEALAVSDLLSMDAATPSAPNLAPAEEDAVEEGEQAEAGEAETPAEPEDEATDPGEGGEDPAETEPPLEPTIVELAQLQGETVTNTNPNAVAFATQSSPLGLVANARSAGLNVVVLPHPDPRATSESMAMMREGKVAVGLGPDFGSTERLRDMAELATSADELPGGGGLVFPDRRMVALYGSPLGGALGVLGEQGTEDAAALAKQYAEQYQAFSPEPVIPAFEIIATVASASAGDDGMYSDVTAAEDLTASVDAITEAGGYAILDLQPGHARLLDQAKIYEELLKRPNVGLALDPEWKLYGDQVHLRQIGHVEIEEVNEVSAWLADLVRENKLPQKVFMLHQFQLQMIRDRDQMEMHPELAAVIHADGHGTPGAKMETWNVMRQDLPEGVWMAWKNFIDEDQPMLNPEQTMNIEPRPWIVSFQ